MNDIKDIKKGDIIYMGHDDFDGKGINECIVTEVHDDIFYVLIRLIRTLNIG